MSTKFGAIYVRDGREPCQSRMKVSRCWPTSAWMHHESRLFSCNCVLHSCPVKQTCCVVFYSVSVIINIWWVSWPVSLILYGHL